MAKSPSSVSGSLGFPKITECEDSIGIRISGLGLRV